MRERTQSRRSQCEGKASQRSRQTREIASGVASSDFNAPVCIWCLCMRDRGLCFVVEKSGKNNKENGERTKYHRDDECARLASEW
jgi:hypothetical protein